MHLATGYKGATGWNAPNPSLAMDVSGACRESAPIFSLALSPYQRPTNPILYPFERFRMLTVVTSRLSFLRLTIAQKIPSEALYWV